MATSLTNLKLGQSATTPGPQDMFGAALQLGSATSTVIEYHGNYKEMASNQDNLSAAVLVQVSPTTRNNLVTPSHSHSLSLFLLCRCGHVGQLMKLIIDYTGPVVVPASLSMARSFLEVSLTGVIYVSP